MKNLCLLLALGLAWTVAAQSQRSSKPNIIFIMSDDHAYQAISAYDDRLIKTPNPRCNLYFVQREVCFSAMLNIIEVNDAAKNSVRDGRECVRERIHMRAVKTTTLEIPLNLEP